jgi:alanyl-tRNA synthetase
VLRRLLRRAARQGRVLGLTDPFLGQVTDRTVDILGGAYAELAAARDRVRSTVTGEEERFGDTLEKGLGLLSDEVARLRSSGLTRLDGDVAFKLYDTYGFPFDLTEDILRGEGFTVDQAGFDAAMEGQRTRARERARFVTATGGGFAEARSRFAGDGVETLESPVIAIAVEGGDVAEARAGETVEVVTEETPFYGESGGQVGDRGVIELPDGSLVEVDDAQRPRSDLIVHRGRVVRGAIRRGDAARLAIDRNRRAATRLNHSATHLLHAALRNRFGDRVHQAGSSVTPERLRFDFTRDARLTDEQLTDLEDDVNRFIRANAAVTSEEMSFDEAIAAGALAFFGDKYGDVVRVLRMGDISTELCGGTHVARTGDIGVFKLRGESAVGAGVRRVEALTGEGALEAIRRRERELREVADLLKSGDEEVAPRIEKLLGLQKELERRLAETQAKLVSGASRDLLADAREVGGIKVLAQRVEQVDGKVLRDLADKLRDRLASGVVVLGGTDGEKVQLLAAVTKDLKGRVDAGAIIKQIAPIVGGGGGGRADFAQAGGKDPGKLDEALARVHEIVAAAALEG